MYYCITHPDTIENISIRMYSNIKIGLDNVVELPILLIPEEGVWHPDLVAVSHGEVLDLAPKIIKLQPVVIPLLSEGDLDTELHLDVIDLLEAPDHQAAEDNSGSLLIRTAVAALKIHLLLTIPFDYNQS